MKFLLTFLLVATVGTATIYYGLPPLWQALGLKVPTPATTPVAAVEQIPSTTLPKGLHFHPKAPPPDAPVAPADAPSVTQSTPLVVGPVASAAPVSQPEKPDTAPATPETKPRIKHTFDGKPPPAPAPGCKSWGITITRTKYYSLSNEWRGHVPGGTIVDIEDIRTTREAEMSLGRIERDNQMTGPFLIDNVDLIRFPSPRSEAAVEQVTTLKQFYDLQGKLDQRIAEITQQNIQANPDTAAYVNAKQEYDAFARKERQLVARRDTASGEERSRLIDQLREMIPAETRLKAAMNAAKPRYDRWKASHSDTVVMDVEKDTQVHDLQQQIAEIEPRVHEILQ